MLSQIFVDTGFVVALINQRDQYHQQASKLADRFEGYPLLVTDAVLLEIGNAFVRNYKKESVEIIEQFFDSDEVEVVRLTPQLFDQGFGSYKMYEDKEWGLVDCISFAVMRAAGVSRALTFDRTFCTSRLSVLDERNSPHLTSHCNRHGCPYTSIFHNSRRIQAIAAVIMLN